MRRIPLIGLAGAMSVCGASQANQPVIGSPLDIVGETEMTTVLELNLDLYEVLRPLEEATFVGVPLGADLVVDLDMHRVRAFAPDASILAVTGAGEVEIEPPDVVMFGGTIAGAADSWAFLSLSPHGVNGIVEQNDDTWVISSGPHGQGEPTQVYRLSDLPEGAIDWYEFVCRAGELDQPHIDFEEVDGGHFDARGFPCRNIEVAIETDHEYLDSLFGGDQAAANAYIATLVGAVSDIYTTDMNIQFEIVFSRLWTTPADPWTETNTIDQLFEFIDYWELNMGGTARDNAHFFSGRGLGGGVAYLPGICNSPFNYALSANLNGFFPMPVQHNSSQNWDLMVTAHEWGHNCGAPHTHDQTPQIDDCAGGDCSITPNGTIMSYCHLCPGGLANVRMEFHTQTVNSYIIPHMNTVTCDMTCPVGVSDFVLLSFRQTTLIPGAPKAFPHDIVSYDPATDTWATVFDGSDVGLGSVKISGFSVIDGASGPEIVMTLFGPATIPGLIGGPGGSTSVDNSDMIRFVPTSLGENTAGSIHFYFDGSDVSLTTNAENLDAMDIDDSGDLFVSCLQRGNLFGLLAPDEDIMRFVPTSLGDVTAGTWSRHFDGSDVGLSQSSSEDVDGFAFDSDTSDLLFSTLGPASMPGPVSGDDEDVFRFTPGTLGDNTTGTWALDLDLSALGIDPVEDIGGMDHLDYDILAAPRAPQDRWPLAMGEATLLCPGDFNADDVVDTRDLREFLNAYVAGDRESDWNMDGVLTSADLVAYLDAYASECRQ